MLSLFSSHRFTTSVSFQRFLSPDDAVAHVPPSKRDAFRTDLCLVQEKLRLGVLTNCADPIPNIQFFAKWLRDGREAPLHKAVRFGTVEDAVRVVGQAFTQLGAPDIRKDALGAIKFEICRQLRCYRKEDAPPSCVKPVPILIIIFILHQAFTPSSTPDRQAIADLVAIAFYFLLRPGEYTGTTSNDAAFRFADVELHVDDRAIDPITCSDDDLHAATFVSLMFTTQKNGTKGEIITHGLSTDPLACPVKATVGRILHLRA
jgi:hypothetical protein